MAPSSASAADWTLVGGTNGAVTRFDAATGVGLGPATTVAGQVASMAISPNGQTAYAVTQTPDAVDVVDLATGAVEATIPLSLTPEDIAITPDGSMAYVTEFFGNVVVPINLATNTAGTPISVADNPEGIAITPDGGTAYVAEYMNDAVVPINLTTRAVGPAIAAGSGPNAVAITPNGSTAYVTDYGSTTVYPIDLTTDTPEPAITVGPNPAGVAISPTGTTAYVTVFSTGDVVPVTIATGAVGTGIPVGAEPFGVTFAPSGATAWASSLSGNTVTPIAVSSATPGTAFGIGSGPQAVAITPDQAPTASFTELPADDDNGLSPTFSGAGSSSPVGSIASYAWNFGDGSTATTTNPVIQHTYAAAGTYTVRLTVTNTAGTSTTQVFTGQTVSREGGPSATTAQAISVARFVGTGPPPIDSVTALRASAHRVSLSGSRVHGRCMPATRADRRAPSCRLAVDVRLRYTLRGSAVRWPVRLTVARLVPGRRSGRRCVAATAANRTHGSRCTRVERLRGSISRTVSRGTHTLVFTGVIGGHRLGPGAYRLTLSATNGRSVTLTIVR